MWKQLELDFAVPQKKKRHRRDIDYEKIYAALKCGPLTFSEIGALAEVERCAIAQVITTLSVRYPIWSPSKGVYKLLTEDDLYATPRDMETE